MPLLLYLPLIVWMGLFELSSRLLRRLPLACELLRLGNLRRGHAPCHKVPKSRRTISPLRRRQVQPHVCADLILRDTKTVVVKHPEIVLGVGIALFS